ncbi:hypothetical protein [Ideonella livida]|uniref:Uncharacterized protein n=1 Tax=Ideonella livida TaxID=2707176 RepID=A0A7C9TJD4_9BURK|nr:hypothetical protein [Ideonella livida]NDY90147.1 hypothetical protein [Ideonella livida]
MSAPDKNPGHASELVGDLAGAREALETIHMVANAQLATIETLAHLVLQAMQSPGFYTGNHSGHAWELVANAMEAIAANASELQNSISAEVEGQGCAHKCPREAARWAARRGLRAVGPTVGG